MNPGEAIRAELVRPGDVIRDRLAESGLSQGQFALAAGMRQQHVWALVHGKRRITVWVAQRLSVHLPDKDGGLLTVRAWLDIQREADLEPVQEAVS